MIRFNLTVIIGLALGLWSASSQAVTVDYRTFGTSFQTPALNSGGITVTGSADVNVFNMSGLGGLGVVGGIDDLFVDGNEFLEFNFNDGPAVNVTHTFQSLIETGSDIFPDVPSLTVFAPGGSSLGTFTPLGFMSPFSVSSLVGNVPIESFRLTANIDKFRIDTVSYELAAVPLPAALPLFLTALAGLGFVGWRKKCFRGQKRSQYNERATASFL